MMRAMILAAGLGTRLRPLTVSIPKPLLPVANRPLLRYTFDLLVSSGISEVIINTHHLAEAFEDRLHSLDSGLRLHVSREKRILGTAGGLKKASAFLERGAFLLLNGDFLADIDLREVVDFHRRSGNRASMALMESAEGGIYLDSTGAIRQFLEPHREPDPEWLRCGFTGIHVLEPDVLGLIPAKSFWEINRQVYPEMLRRGWPVGGYLHRGYWREAGDPPGYLAANLDVIAGEAGGISVPRGAGSSPPAGAGITPPVLIGGGALLGGDLRLGPGAVIGPQASIGDGAAIARSVILEGAGVAPGEIIAGTIRSPLSSLEVSVVNSAGREEAKSAE